MDDETVLDQRQFRGKNIDKIKTPVCKLSYIKKNSCNIGGNFHKNKIQIIKTYERKKVTSLIFLFKFNFFFQIDQCEDQQTLILRCTLTNLHNLAFPVERCKVENMSSLGWRENMQDSHICGANNIEKGISLFAVFDGHGGSHVSKYLEEHFIEVLKSQTQFQERKYEIALQKTFQILDQHLDSEEGIKKLKNYNYNPKFLSTTKSQQLQIPPAFLTGSTANVVLITPEKIYVANCGDSRSAMYISHPTSSRNNPNSNQFSSDHKPENEQQKLRIQKANGFVKNGRVDGNFSVSRAFGDLFYKKNHQLSYKQQKMICHPDVRVFQRPKMRVDDSLNQHLNFILIGCDGIWQRFGKGSAGLLQIIRCDLVLGLSLSEAMKNMLNLLVSKNVIQTKGHGCDNMSAIIIQFLD